MWASANFHPSGTQQNLSRPQTLDQTSPVALHRCEYTPPPPALKAATLDASLVPLQNPHTRPVGYPPQPKFFVFAPGAQHIPPRVKGAAQHLGCENTPFLNFEGRGLWFGFRV